MRLEVYQQASGNRHEANYSDDTTKMFSLNDIDEIFEKISEQKLADKDESIFNVGDYIKHNKANIICKVISVNSGSYYVENIETSGRIELFNAEQNFHLWTIQDAKDGDVLFSDLMCGKTFIYNGVNSDMAILYSFIISNDGNDVLPYHIGKPNTGIGTIEDNKNIIHPATKEQRDTLFAAMKAEGYEWNAEKKEVKRRVITENLI
jgi:hypothetical protein